MMALGWTAPWLLVGLAALPVIWLILRAVPPAPVRHRFPAVALLIGLGDEGVQAARTPVWLLMLRIAALAALIVGLAGPVLNPDTGPARRAPLLVVIDGDWAQAAIWARVTQRLGDALRGAGRDGRPVALLSLTAPETAPVFRDAAALMPALVGLKPQPWRAQADPLPALPAGEFDTMWLASGVDFTGRTALAQALAARGRVQLDAPALPQAALSDLRVVDGQLTLRMQATAPLPLRLQAVGPDPAGVTRVLAEWDQQAAPIARDVTLDLPIELRNRVTRVQIAGQASAGAVVLGDDLIRRRKVGLVSTAATEAQALLSPDHYLEQALQPSVDLTQGALPDLIAAAPDVLILPDIAHPPQAEALVDWVRAGGLLIRFAGPNLAQAGSTDDPLLPVRLRPGDRSVGGALSWGAPRRIAPFAADGPFAGLVPPDETLIRAQVMAEPGPDLAGAVLASLEDATPLVTRKPLGQGQVVLFHVTANADWSNLPISGLFVQMIDRLIAGAGTGQAVDRAAIAASAWQAETWLDGFGAASPAPPEDPVAGAALARATVGPDLRPGLYRAGDRRVALNAQAPDADFAPAVDWPGGVERVDQAAAPSRPLGGWLIAAAIAALALDVLASLAVAGRLRRVAIVGLAVMLVLVAQPPAAHADETDTPPVSDTTLAAADRFHLARIASGDAAVDDMAERGLRGLTAVLNARTTIDAGGVLTVDPDTDDLSALSLIYWPVTAGQAAPSVAGYAALNRYLAHGGMILFDTRDGDLAGLGAATPEAEALRNLAAPLDIPALEVIPPDHVLTRSFYLLRDLPGRHAGVPVWVAARAPLGDPAQAPERNDGVTPVVIGGGDWAAAWAIDDTGLPLAAVGQGFAGEDQREMAFRFGVNLAMHVLTGNYKADQVHAAEILERLGR
ncbi:DUF4159 domain-containing protein [Paracoccus sp. p3-h83]|uniref:DUF4159 domain-containing protein n=1 Tax=Paracoccus sp. p3-h83 TaxID=3342805 RepID=UPI0035B94CEE